MLSVAIASFLGLGASEWTAGATVVLVLVTGVYVYVTWRIARAASQSASDSAAAALSAQDAALAAKEGNELQLKANELSAAAAKSARTAALAAKHSVELQLAQVPIDFTVTYRAYKSDSLGSHAYLTVKCEASTVYFHELRSLGSLGQRLEGESLFEVKPPTQKERDEISAGIFRGILCPMPPGNLSPTLPLVLHRGETIDLLFPRPTLDPAQDPHITVRVLYSLTRRGGVREIERDVQVEPELLGPAAFMPPESPTHGSET